MNRPGFEKSPAIGQLFDHARGLAAETGFGLKELKAATAT